jgi:hypothetical protein
MIALENSSEVLAYGAPKSKENIKEIIWLQAESRRENFCFKRTTGRTIR